MPGLRQEFLVVRNSPDPGKEWIVDHPQPDPALKEKFEAEAFEHMDALYRTALRMTRNPKDAEDLVQETYLRAYRFYHQYQQGSNFRAWIFTILVNTFTNQYRKRVKEPPKVDFAQVEGVYEDLEKEPRYVRLADLDRIKERFSDEVKQAIDQLPEDYRLVFLLAALEDLSYKEIAEIVGCPIGTVMSRLFRARQLLQRELSEYAHREGIVRQEQQGGRNDAVR